MASTSRGTQRIRQRTWRLSRLLQSVAKGNGPEASARSLSTQQSWGPVLCCLPRRHRLPPPAASQDKLTAFLHRAQSSQSLHPFQCCHEGMAWDWDDGIQIFRLGSDRPPQIIHRGIRLTTSSSVPPWIQDAQCQGSSRWETCRVNLLCEFEHWFQEILYGCIAPKKNFASYAVPFHHLGKKTSHLFESLACFS